MKKFFITYLLAVFAALPVVADVASLPGDSLAAVPVGSVGIDTTLSASHAVAADTATVSKRNFFQRFIDYFGNANKERPDKKFDVSFIGGPFYNSALGVGIGVVGSGLYRIKGCDRSLQPSNVSLFGSVSTTGFYMVGLRGNNIFPEERITGE